MKTKDLIAEALARANENQPAYLFEAMFFRLLDKCRQFSPGHRFKFKNKLYLLDTTTIDLCLSLFPWAKFRKAKGAIKLHVGLDADGYLPSFISLTEGKGHESRWAKALNLPRGSFVVFDRGFADYSWYAALTKNGIYFVTRLKSNAVIKNGPKRSDKKISGITEDREIFLSGIATPLRQINFLDPENGKELRFVTNADLLDAKTVAELCKERWQIEVFFKWIKQNLKVKTFLGTSKNAVLTKIWTSLCAYLLLAFLKLKVKIGISMQQILRLLQLNLSERDLLDFLKPAKIQLVECRQFYLF